jgi:hypothetical protein
MMPLEIFDYKRRWRAHAHVVTMHSDLRWVCRDWVKANVEVQCFVIQEYSAPYEDTYLFERRRDALSFQKEFSGRVGL